MNLKDFCGKGYHHEVRGLDEPFSSGAWTYGTDAVICIRIPRLADVTREVGFDPGILFDQTEGQTEWQAIPTGIITELPCGDCGGKGYVRMCKHCYGQGCGHCKHDGQIGCLATHPDAEACENCLGSGVVKEGSVVMDGSGGQVRLSAVYLDRLKTLPNVMIALPVSEDSRLAARIKFDGGEGLLMPMRL